MWTVEAYLIHAFDRWSAYMESLEKMTSNKVRVDLGFHVQVVVQLFGFISECCITIAITQLLDFVRFKFDIIYFTY